MEYGILCTENPYLILQKSKITSKFFGPQTRLVSAKKRDFGPLRKNFLGTTQEFFEKIILCRNPLGIRQKIGVRKNVKNNVFCLQIPLVSGKNRVFGKICDENFNLFANFEKIFLHTPKLELRIYFILRI